MRILLIDDDQAFTAMMAEYLGSEGFTCVCANEPLDGLQQALSGQFDAAVLDVMMPQLDGMELLRRLRRVSDLPVLMLTAKGDSIDRVIGLELGADDYLPKPVYPRELVARLRAVLRRFQADAPAEHSRSEFSVGPLRIAPARRESWLGDNPLTLTATEFGILMQLALKPGEVLTKDELSEETLGRPRERYDRSIDVHVSNIRHKIGQASPQGLEIETVRSIGYRLRLTP